MVAAWLAPHNLRSCHDPLMVGPLRIPAWVPMAWRRALWRRIDQRYIDPVALPELNAARQAVGLPPVAHFLPHLGAVPDQSVTLFPAWYAATAPDWPQPLLRGGFPLFEPAGHTTLPPAVRHLPATTPTAAVAATVAAKSAAAAVAVTMLPLLVTIARMTPSSSRRWSTRLPPWSTQARSSN